MGTLPRWIDELLANVEATPASHGDSHFTPVAHHETVIGILEDESVKKLYSRYVALCEKTIITYPPENPSENACATIMKRLQEVNREIKKRMKELDILRDLFWACVQNEMNTWDENMGIRENWQVVIWKDEDEDEENAGDNNIDIWRIALKQHREIGH
jgi:hypothetical protein